MSPHDQVLSRHLHAIADPTRRKILQALKARNACSLGKETGLCACDIEERIHLSQPTISHHMAILEKAGLVAGHLELSADGKAMKYFELAPFELRLNADVITEALRAGGRDAHETHEQPDGQRKESDL